MIKRARYGHTILASPCKLLSRHISHNIRFHQWSMRLILIYQILLLPLNNIVLNKSFLLLPLLPRTRMATRPCNPHTPSDLPPTDTPRPPTTVLSMVGAWASAISKWHPSILPEHTSHKRTNLLPTILFHIYRIALLLTLLSRALACSFYIPPPFL